MIPTAIHFLKKEVPLFSGDATDFYTDNDIAAIMRDYAQLHVQAALEAAADKKTYGMLVVPLFTEEQKESILKSYSLDNIK